MNHRVNRLIHSGCCANVGEGIFLVLTHWQRNRQVRDTETPIQIGIARAAVPIQAKWPLMFGILNFVGISVDLISKNYRSTVE